MTTSAKVLAAKRKALVKSLEIKGYIPCKQAADQIFTKPYQIHKLCKERYVRSVTVGGITMVHWCDLVAYLWHKKPDLAMTLELPMVSKCIVCGDACQLGEEACGSCEVLRCAK